MELLIIKTGNMYIRVKEEKYLTVNLDKASVFPMEKLDQVKQHEADLNAVGFVNVRLKKLVLTEEDL